MPSHHHNPSYCGVCQKWVVGLSQHERRSKSHLKLYEPIRKRLVEERAAKQRGDNNLARAETIAALV